MVKYYRYHQWMSMTGHASIRIQCCVLYSETETCFCYRYSVDLLSRRMHPITVANIIGTAGYLATKKAGSPNIWDISATRLSA
jgi:hypothetical protein